MPRNIRPRDVDVSFVNGVIATMREEKVGVEPAIVSFSERVKSGPAYAFAQLIGKGAEYLADIERGAKLAREAVEKAREIVALADRPTDEIPDDPRIEHTVAEPGHDFPAFSHDPTKCVLCRAGKHTFIGS